jgi:C4-dicarboxylate-specific signal transduction histidine kinase
LLNLVINASDALEGREHRKIALAVFEEENRIVIRVEDNGCGMSEEQVKNLFRPFHTTKAQGTGLGLVIVKKLLAAIKGAIKVSSLRNIGTTVDITIPGRNRECKETDKLLASA